MTILQRIKKFFDDRVALGKKKYGTTLDDNNEDDFTQHLLEELADAMQYLMKRKKMFEDGEVIVIKRQDFIEAVDALEKLTNSLKRFYYGD